MGLHARRGAGLLAARQADDAFIESLNGKFRTERLNAHWFMSLEDAPEDGGLA
jgi:hypothetical protein